jgi:hypothetical protein
MFRTSDSITIAALVAATSVLFPPSITTGETGAPKAALKGDRLEVRIKGSTCPAGVWPNYNSACLVGLLPGNARSVRIVSTDRLPGKTDVR